MDLGLRGKVALVTGGSKGIGLATARCFVDEGCDVAICGRGADALEAARADLTGHGGGVTALEADVTRPEDCQRLIDAVIAERGRLDILVNMVGGDAGGLTVLESEDDDWRASMEINLMHAVRMMRLAVPHMAARSGGAIVNIASISGWHPQLAGSGQYGAFKAALIFDTERWALEFARHGVRVNTVSPGSIWGDGNGWDDFLKSEPEGYAEYVRTGFPMGRLGHLDEVADVVVFVACPRANWINGRNVPVDGLEQPVPARGYAAWEPPPA